MSRSRRIRLETGLTYLYVLPRHASLPAIPAAAYRSAALGRPTSYKVDREAGAVKALHGPDGEEVVFEGDGRTAVAADGSTVAARITRKGITVTAVRGEPIRVSRIGRLAEGIAEFPDGFFIRYSQAGAGGTIGAWLEPSVAVGDAARFNLSDQAAADAMSVAWKPMPDAERLEPRLAQAAPDAPDALQI